MAGTRLEARNANAELLAEGRALCSRCREAKPVADFSTNNTKGRGLNYYCRSCSNAYEREKYGGAKPSARPRYLLKTYGLTVDQFDDMLIAQSGLCAICSGQMVHPKVDHDHASGAIRGLLCNTCNRALGLLHDDVDVLMSAAAYLLAQQDVLGGVS